MRPDMADLDGADLDGVTRHEPRKSGRPIEPMTNVLRMKGMIIPKLSVLPAALLALVLALSLGGFAGAARADGFNRIATQAEFLSLVGKADLRNLGVTLQVRANGSIRGSAFGRRVTGTWTWKDGYFCRAMSWGTTDFPMNCQTVAMMANTLRFTADQGKGETADLRLR